MKICIGRNKCGCREMDFLKPYTGLELFLGYTLYLKCSNPLIPVQHLGMHSDKVIKNRKTSQNRFLQQYLL